MKRVWLAAAAMVFLSACSDRPYVASAGEESLVLVEGIEKDGDIVTADVVHVPALPFAMSEGRLANRVLVKTRIDCAAKTSGPIETTMMFTTGEPFNVKEDRVTLRINEYGTAAADVVELACDPRIAKFKRGKLEKEELIQLYLDQIRG